MENMRNPVSTCCTVANCASLVCWLGAAFSLPDVRNLVKLQKEVRWSSLADGGGGFIRKTHLTGGEFSWWQRRFWNIGGGVSWLLKYFGMQWRSRNFVKLLLTSEPLRRISALGQTFLQEADKLFTAVRFKGLFHSGFWPNTLDGTLNKSHKCWNYFLSPLAATTGSISLKVISHQPPNTDLKEQKVTVVRPTGTLHIKSQNAKVNEPLWWYRLDVTWCLYLRVAMSRRLF